MLARQGLTSVMERVSFFFLKEAQKELFYLQLERVDQPILLFINYINLDLRLGLRTGLTKVFTFHFNNTKYLVIIKNIRLLPKLRPKHYYGFVAITYTLMLGYCLQDINLITQEFQLLGSHL